MTFKIYYDDIDGELYPKWVLLPNGTTDNGFITYNIESPFERFYQEDFHNELKLITVSQGSLTTNPFLRNQFNVNLEQLTLDLAKQGIPGDAIYETDYFIVLVDDLEELLQYDVRNFFMN